MSLNSPPKAEKLLPILKGLLEEKYKLTFSEEWEPFRAKTWDLLSSKDPSHLSLLYLERLILENYQAPFYKEDLLELLLEMGPLYGYVVYFSWSPPLEFPFFQLAEKYFFYPLFFGELPSLFKKLWAEGGEFISYHRVLKDLPKVEELDREAHLCKRLCFTRLSPKALENIIDLWDLYLQGRGESFLTSLEKANHYLLVSEEELEALKIPLEIIDHFGNKKHLYIISSPTLKELKSALKGLKGPYGILWGERLKEELYQGLDPLLLGFAALEHAKRAATNYHLLDPFTLHVLGDLLYEWEDYGGALRLYERAKPYTLQPIELTLSEASIYYLFGDLKRAEKALRGKLCGCLKEDPRVHYNLGVIYLELGDKGKGEYHLYKAYLLDKEEPLFRTKLLKYLWDEGRLEEIEEILREVKELTIEDKIFLGKISFLKKDYTKALEYLKEILTYQERDGLSLYFLAWLYLYFKMDGEVSQLLLKEAKEKLPQETFERLSKEFGLPS